MLPDLGFLHDDSLALVLVCVEPEAMLGEVFAQGKAFPHRPLQLSMFTFSDEAKSCSDDLYDKTMKFDLVLSLEVAEHIAVQYQSELIRRLASATSKYLVFSAARPDQGGTGHIDDSMHSRTWWIEQFSQQGLTYLPQLSRALRYVTSRPDRPYDLGYNLIAMGANGAPDVEEIPPLAHDCMYHPKFKIEWREGDRQYLDYEEREYSQKHNLPEYLPLRQPCPFPSDENMEKRRLWVEGQEQALWPELDHLIRLVKSHELKCRI